jgi:hypothetical protein
MKKVLAVLGVIVALVILAVLFLVFVKKPAQRPAQELAIKATPQMVERGKYLVENVSACVDCHSETDHTKWSNPMKPGREGSGGECWTHEMNFPGTLCSKNLTADKATGLGGWSDGEIVRAIREGVDKNGNALFNLMPYDLFAHMSDNDAQAVVAYLRTLPAINNPIQDRQLDGPLPVIVKFMPHPLSGAVAEPDKANPAAYGQYLTTIAGCVFCHTPVDSHEMPLAGQEFSGGHHFKTHEGSEVVSANLTSDPSGITGRLTQDQFIAAFKAYDNEAGHSIGVDPKKNTVMPWVYFSGMSTSDLGAIYAYLKTVKPIHNVVEKFPHPANGTATTPAP